MVERISLNFKSPDRSEFRKRVLDSLAKELTEEEIAEQKASFIYGNAPERSGTTKETARRAATHTRLVAAE